ncbi:restriction endonuclease [Neorhizobium sp. BETTINA12A]|uniref:restriction endonuclease n=1 Tax=Neorhizobium sp. BETTINA12A TaxID=2908924 RepID=UPI001FF17B87|nr:restriction endonuclease [Neorhizobium sp. BETTINA12A]MCJ9753565.1 restriction endonuclease [Neorhizobium sp. BETTINA12A]
MDGQGSLELMDGENDKSLVLPIANEFSPGAPVGNPISLPVVLKLVKDASGREAQVEAIRAYYFSDAAAKQPDAKGRQTQQRQLASNVLIGMDSFKVYNEETEKLTIIGEELLSALSEAEANRLFAKHILMELHGVEILRIMRSMASSGRTINKTSLLEELNRHGFVTKAGTPISTSSKNHLLYLSWLRKADVLPTSGYSINEDVLKSLVGMSIDDANKAIELTSRQKVFAAALRRDFDVNGMRDVFVKDLRAVCQATHPSVFKRTDDLRRAIINPLVSDGWLTHSETAGGRSQGRGRGGGSGTVRATEQLASVDPAYLGLANLAGIPGEVRSHLQRPIGQIMDELKSVDTGVKGLALETLAVRILYELGLTPVAFRERGAENDGAEVDLIAEGVDTHFHRWMVQCKNMPKVSVSALAKEIGMAVIYRAQVILIITTGVFTSTVHLHARQLAETSGQQAILIDRDGLAIYLEEGVAGLFRQFEQRARDILEWKAPQRGVQIEEVG